MLKKLLISFSAILLICSISAINSFAEVYYGAFYNEQTNKYEVIRCVKDCETADFVMRFASNPKPKRLKKYENSINKRLGFFKRRFTKGKPWPYIFSGSYGDLPTINGWERHHLVSKFAINNAITDIKSDMAPASIIRKDVHEKTGSYKSMPGSKEFRENEKNLLSSGNSSAALDNGMNDMFSAFSKTNDLSKSQLENIHTSKIEENIWNISYVKEKMSSNSEDGTIGVSRLLQKPPKQSIEDEPSAIELKDNGNQSNDVEDLSAIVGVQKTNFSNMFSNQ